MTATQVGLEEMLETRMRYAGERQKVLAENVASVGIPHYKAKDLAPLDFNHLVNNQSYNVDLKITQKGHLSGINLHPTSFLAVKQRETFDQTATGNNSVVEEQMMKTAKNAADYQLSSTLYKKIGNLFKEALGLQTS